MLARSRCALIAALAHSLVGCFNPPARSSSDDTGEPTTASDTTTGTTAPGTPTTGDPACPCPANAPYCPDGACVDCTAVDCAAELPNTPHCAPDLGRCVECLDQAHCPTDRVCHPELHTCERCVAASDCPPEEPRCDDTSRTCTGCVDDGDCVDRPLTPTCDLVSRACRGCREHGECPGSACDLDAGTCFPADRLTHTHVDSAACQPGNTCLAGSPCCELTDVVLSSTIDLSYVILHVAPGVYEVPVAIVADKQRIAILAQPGAILAPKDDGSPLSLFGQSALFVAGLALTTSGGAPSPGLECVGGLGVWFDDGEVSEHAAAGVRAEDCKLQLRRSKLLRNSAGVLAAPGGRIRLENTVVSGSESVALTSIGDGALDIVYSTVADGHPADGQNHLLLCEEVSVVALRNSALLDVQGAPVDLGCAPAITYSAYTQGTLSGLALSKPIPAADVPLLFASFGGDDLHLRPGPNALVGVARWQPGDPATDLDGQPRPTTPGAMDAAGVDTRAR